ncbi:MAG TPA: OsmC family protein [Gaiellaceae bacterium]|jgi:organic hydroperoxide reductase OsmC/OhrA|nr:OsmC family protein [Gaiellaceae bacterium]
MSVRPKLLEFEASIAVDGRLSAEDCPPLGLPTEWTAEHLLLAALLRCSLTSLRYHAKRLGVDATGRGTARGNVTKREADGRYAFVDVEASLVVELAPERPDDEVGELLARAERDCFIGASLTVTPSYTWQVNGREVSARAAPS